MASTTSSASIKIVTLTREQRDGLADHVQITISAVGGALEYAASRYDCEKIRSEAGLLPACIGVLDQIGWQRMGDGDSYRLDVSPDIQSLIEEIEPAVRGCIRDNQDTKDSEETRRMLENDLAALAAVELLQAVGDRLTGGGE